MTNDKKNHCLTDIIMYKQGTLLMTENKPNSIHVFTIKYHQVH